MLLTPVYQLGGMSHIMGVCGGVRVKTFTFYLLPDITVNNVAWAKPFL
jgi:hypothetical protein